MSATPAHPPPTTPLRAQLQALLQHQATTPADDLPRDDAQALAQLLTAVAAWCQQHPRGHTWSSAEQTAWQRVAQALVDSAAALPAVALLAGGRAGPLLADVARLLRAEGVHEDEALELDEAIRWWEGARRAGLPVDADFGECWRALEWLGLLQHLGRLAAGQSEKQEAALLAAVAKVALRYGPLKPLLRLLPAQPGAEVGAGYTF